MIGFGVALSIPLVFIGAAIVSNLLNRFPWLVWIAGGVIAYVAGELIAKEPILGERCYSHNIQLLFTVVVLVVTLAAAYLSQNRHTPWIIRGALPWTMRFHQARPGRRVVAGDGIRTGEATGLIEGTD